MNNTILDVNRKPVVVFDPENQDHRRYIAEFQRQNTWNTSPVLFYAPGDISVREHTAEELLRYYLAREFAVQAQAPKNLLKSRKKQA
jgi:hypothetical protein